MPAFLVTAIVLLESWQSLVGSTWQLALRRVPQVLMVVVLIVSVIRMLVVTPYEEAMAMFTDEGLLMHTPATPEPLAFAKQIMLEHLSDPR